jgi:hypothetical protein
MSERMKGEQNPFYNKKHSNETKDLIRKINIGNKNHLGHKHSEETKKLLS